MFQGELSTLVFEGVVDELAVSVVVGIGLASLGDVASHTSRYTTPELLSHLRIGRPVCHPTGVGIEIADVGSDTSVRIVAEVLEFACCFEGRGRADEVALKADDSLLKRPLVIVRVR